MSSTVENELLLVLGHAGGAIGLAGLLSDLAADATPLIPPRQWEDAVFDEGFYDQSHFIHDFRSFTGYAPGALPRENFYMYHILTKPGFGEGCAHVQSEK